MKKLSRRNKTLIGMGANMEGSFKEGYYYIEEALYCDEAQTIHDFCKYIDDKIGGAGPANYDILFKAFTSPDNKEAQLAAIKIKTQLDKFKKLNIN